MGMHNPVNTSLRRRALEPVLQKLAKYIPQRLFLDPALFDVYEQRGWHVTPVDFYQPIPDTRALPPELWSTTSELTGLDLNEAGQLDLIEELSARFRAEYERLDERDEDALGFRFDQRSFGPVDAEMLFSMVRWLKPKRVVEIGSGASTLIIATALRRNAFEGAHADYAVIDPYPPSSVQGGVPGVSELIAEEVQRVPLEQFTALEDGDILFVDSSHVVRTGGDVLFEYLEIVPRLAPGVVVHAHDVFLPDEYPRDWVIGRRRFWSEQYLLQSFLAFNNQFEILWAARLMDRRHPDVLTAAFQRYDADACPGSFWFRRRPEQPDVGP
jgi:hypothetical protein